MTDRSSLYIDSDFLKLWVGESISVFGSQFSPIAIQYFAYNTLHAQPLQFGILAALGTASFLLFGIPVGLYADRHRRKRTMIYADVGRALILSSIPLFAIFGGLSIELFYMVAFTTGVLTVFFEICYQSYLPSLVERSKLIVANSRLQLSASISQISGGSLAGFAVYFVSAPVAILGDVIGFFGSAGFLGSIRKPEPDQAPVASRSAWKDVKEGLSVVFKDTRLRSIAGCTATSNLFSSAYGAVLIPFLLSVGIPVWEIGPLAALGVVGGIAGAIFSERISKRLGVGWTIIVFALLFGIAQVPLYFVTAENAVLVLPPVFFALSAGVVVYNIVQVSFRQSLVPARLQGRMNATMRTIVWGTLPIGGLLGGLMSEILGYREAVGVAVGLGAFAFMWVLFSPVRGIKEMPTPLDEPTPAV